RRAPPRAPRRHRRRRHRRHCEQPAWRKVSMRERSTETRRVGATESKRGRRAAVLCGALALTAACGGETPEPRTPEHEEAARPDKQRPSIATSAEVGALDEAKVSQAFRGALKDLQRCLKDGTGRNELEGGEIAFLVKIGSSG